MQNGDDRRAGPGPARFGRRGEVISAAPAEAPVAFGRRPAARAASLPESSPRAEKPLFPRQDFQALPAALPREDELAAFFGPHAEAYLATYRAWQASGAADAHPLLSWRGPLRGDRLWAACLFPVPWLFYRKLYGHGAAALTVSLASALLAPDIVSAIVSIAISALVMRYGKRLYVDRALKATGIADRRGLTGAERASYLRHAGGLSVLGLVAGMLLFVFPIAWRLTAGL